MVLHIINQQAIPFGMACLILLFVEFYPRVKLNDFNRASRDYSRTAGAFIHRVLRAW